VSTPFAEPRASPRKRPLGLSALHVWGWLLLGLGPALAAAPLARSPAEYLQHFDSDRDGRIALTEYQDYLSQGFRQMDRNGDGRLSSGELPPGARTRRAPTLDAHRRSLAISFERQDADRNGYLDARELAAPPR
jgi:Ca2+-binding EF-hand superfamily protein